MSINYQIWDVFTKEKLTGNPLAVVTDASGLPTDTMQKIAKEFNLSETSFIVNKENADFRARYFTPAREVPMAGHPTIGTVYSLWDSGLIDTDEVRLELNAGIFPIKLDYQNDSLQRVWMNQGIPKIISECTNRLTVAKALGIAEDDIAELPLQIITAGLEFLFVPLKSLAVLAKANLNLALLSDILAPEHRAVFAFSLDAPESDVRARMFAEAFGVIEDPATGSAHGPLGLYMASNNLLDFENGVANFVSHQRVEMGRASQIELRVIQRPEGFEVSIAGQAVKLAEGKLFL